jgi:hypothetical protein
MYVPKKELWKHQKAALKKMKGKEYFALLMAMRTGKSATLLTDFGTLESEGKVNDLLLIAPCGVYKTWLTAISEHVAESLSKRLAIYLWSAGANSQKAIKKLESFMAHKGPRILLIDAEALSSVDRAKKLCLKFLTRKVMLAVDESTLLRNPKSRRTKFIISDKLRAMTTYRRILSGLPSPNSPFDLWAQFYLLNPDILGWSFTNFKHTYAEIHKVCMIPNTVLYAKLKRCLGGRNRLSVAGVGMVDVEDLPRQIVLKELEARKAYVPTVPILKRYRGEEELHALIEPHSFRVRLEDCYDMPPKVYMRRDVELTSEQERIYKELKTKSMAELQSKDFVTASMVMVRLLRMHQVLCGHVKDEEGKEHSIPENRTRQLMEQLAEYDGKAIIWAAYDIDIRKISEALAEEYGKDSVARFWGGNSKTREEEEKQFKTNPRCRFMVATQFAGGKGRNWSEANLMVYYSNSSDLEHRLQSEERGEGVGKQVPMAIVDLIARDTIEEKIIATLRKKMDISSTILGDQWREWLI